MDLQFRIDADYHGSISTVNTTTEISTDYPNGYLPDTSVDGAYQRYTFTDTSDSSLSTINYGYRFKVDDSKIIEILKRCTSDSETIDLYFYPTYDDSISGSIRFTLPEDGYYKLDCIVLPTTSWFKNTVNLNFSTAPTSLTDNQINTAFPGGIYVIGEGLDSSDIYDIENQVYKITTNIRKKVTEITYVLNSDSTTYTKTIVDSIYDENDNLITTTSSINENSIGGTDSTVTSYYYTFTYETVTLDLIDELNYINTTKSESSYKIFSIDRLKHCYINNATQVLNSSVKCNKIDDTLKFNRDFLLMTINVINFYLEEDEYDAAEIVLERIKCYNLCESETGTNNHKLSCGCHH